MDKKFVEDITSRDVDFAKWYTDIIKKADLVDYSAIRGCMIIRPNGYAIWENMQKVLDGEFKKTGHENVYMPMFISESLLQKEKDHVEGFAPEVAWVTHGGAEKLAERLCVRPTSETLFCDHYAKIVNSYRDLPKLYNQWCSVVRWEKTTRPFLRTTEFLWQEGHTAHATAEEAQWETLRMLDVYAGFFENYLAIPVIKGRKSDKEKFAGAEATYTIESMMHDGKALQSGTTHNFGDGFARAFDITYTDQNNALRFVHQTSWGLSTRMIGALIMVHGDDNGLVLPPKIAPVELMIIPIAQHKPGVSDKVNELHARLGEKFRVKADTSDKMAGWKFSEYEMRGIPLRLEIGPRDIENNSCVLVRRDNYEKITVSLDELEGRVSEILDDIQISLYNKALKNREDNTFTALDFDELIQIMSDKSGFVKAMWCGARECEDKIKEQTTATLRCMPFNEEPVGDKCVCCGKAGDTVAYFAKAY